MTKKTWVKVRSGLLEPKHRKKLGARIWLYLHILDCADWDTGTIEGWTDKTHAEKIDMPHRTVQKQRQRLAEDGYITCAHTFQALRITISNWINPREYSGEVKNKTVYPKERTHSTQNSVPIQSQNGVPLHIDHNINTSKNSQLKTGAKRTAPKPKKKRFSDERLKHAAIIAYREAARLTPAVAIRDDICEIEDVEKWGGIVKAWIGKGWNPRNIAGMLEVYNNGWRTNGRKTTRQDSMAAAFEKVAKEQQR